MLHSGRIGGGNPVGGAGRAGVANPARRSIEVACVHDVCAEGRGRSRIGLRGTRENRVECFHGLDVRGTVSFMARLALWCEMLLSPAGEGAGHKFRVSLSY